MDYSCHGLPQHPSSTILSQTLPMGLVSLRLSFFVLIESNSTWKLAKLDLEQFEIKKIQILPSKYNGKIVLTFLQFKMVVHPSVVWMVWIWDLMVILNVRTISLIWVNLPFGVKCCKVLCPRNIFCANETCAYKVKYGI